MFFRNKLYFLLIFLTTIKANLLSLVPDSINNEIDKSDKYLRDGSSLGCSLINSFEEVAHVIDSCSKDDLVIFDIDDTLIHHPYDGIYKVIEPGVIDIIKKLKSRDCKVVCLTATPSIREVQEYRYKKLKEIDIILSDNAYPNVTFKKFESILGDKGRCPAIHEGVIYSDIFPKGIVLEEFLKTLPLLPKRIVFFDDKYENIVSVKNTCEKYSIFHNLFYYFGSKKFEVF